MKQLFLEFKLIKEDTIKISMIMITIPIFNILLFLKKDFIKPADSINVALYSLFGSAQYPQLNWVNWILFCFGYVILIQMFFKPRARYFEYNMLLQQQKTDPFWNSRLLFGAIFSVIYIASSFLIAVTGFYFHHIDLYFNVITILLFVCIAINFYIHALLWLCLQMYLSTHIANIVIMSLIYGGTQFSSPIFPLYFSMLDHFQNENVLLLILPSELIVIFILGFLIKRKGKTKDYF